MASPTTEPADVKRAILMAVDETEASDRACDFIAKNLLRRGDEVHFFHVVAPPEPKVIGGYYGPMAGIPVMIEPADPAVERARVMEATKYIMEHFVPKVEGTPWKVEVAAEQDNADNVGRLLCERADKLKAAALVMARQGVVHRMFLGSASYYCMQHCTQPLVIIH